MNTPRHPEILKPPYKVKTTWSHIRREVDGPVLEISITETPRSKRGVRVEEAKEEEEGSGSVTT